MNSIDPSLSSTKEDTVLESDNVLQTGGLHSGHGGHLGGHNEPLLGPPAGLGPGPQPGAEGASALHPINGPPGSREIQDGQTGGASEKLDEYIKTRKDSHRNVERRRREAINDGINELKDLIPDKGHPLGKSKGNIIRAAINHIRDLKMTEASNVEKWTLERLLSDQALHEVRAENDALKARVAELEAENAQLKRSL